VTSLGLVQLTRKRLGTGLIEAFSTPCPECAGRGILLHTDPVDSAPTSGRKSDSGRRGKRSKKGKGAEDVPLAKVPAHPAGEHPMFKAMAAANGKHEDDDLEGVAKDEAKGAEEVAEVDAETIKKAVVDTADAELEDDDLDEDYEDEDEDSDEDDDEIDLDEDDEDDDLDDDIEVIDSDDSDDEDSDDDDDDEDSDDDDSDEDVDEDESDFDNDDVEQPAATVGGGRQRRRAAARPAGPPIHDN
jgi:ribonuclease E